MLKKLIDKFIDMKKKKETISLKEYLSGPDTIFKTWRDNTGNVQLQFRRNGALEPVVNINKSAELTRRLVLNLKQKGTVAIISKGRSTLSIN